MESAGSYDLHSLGVNRMLTVAMKGSYPRSPKPPRPDLLGQALDRWRKGELEDADLERAFQRRMVESLAEQVAGGAEVVWEGQTRWDGPANYIMRRLGGITAPEDKIIGQRGVSLEPESTPASAGNGSPAGNGHRQRLAEPEQGPEVVERIQWRRPLLVDDFRFLKERSPVPLRPALTGPISLASLCRPSYYGNRREALLYDFASALKRELEGLATAGAEFILIDEPLLSAESPDNEWFLPLYGALLDGISARVFLSAGGSLLDFSDELSKLPLKGCCLNLIDHPEDEALLDLASYNDQLTIELGVVSGRGRKLEAGEEIVGLLMRCSAYTDPGRLWISSSCGMGGLDRDLAFEKIRLLYSCAEFVRRRFAGSGGSVV